MDSSEERKNKITSEELADTNKTEGEIADYEAEAAAGGAVYQPLKGEDWKPIEPRQKR